MSANREQWITLAIVICCTTLCSLCCILPVASGSLSYEPEYSTIPEAQRTTAQDWAVNSRELWLRFEHFIDRTYSYMMTFTICGVTLILWFVAFVLGMRAMFLK